MPLDANADAEFARLRFDFVAIDEVQLLVTASAAIFTDRILHARGAFETMFMGAETVAPLLWHFCLMQNSNFANGCHA